jgi:glutamine synthetase
MQSEQLVMVCCSDIAGQLRGKAIPVQDLQRRLASGIGWTPTNIQITAFTTIADTPFGPFGDLLLMPDMETAVAVDFGSDSAPERFILADLTHTDGKPWECCLRTLLKQALDDLREETGLLLLCAFEHEFHYTGGDHELGSAYNLRAFRQQGKFGEHLVWALRQAGVAPDTFMPEYGPGQYEITCAPQLGLRAADQALIVREMARATAHRLVERVSFAPVVTPEIVGNGLHIHMSLHDLDNRPVTYDPAEPFGVSRVAGRFAAGILRHLPALVAITAPAVVSYRRLAPHRWSAAYNNLGFRDREAGIRICPVVEKPGFDAAAQFNLEFRAADAAASPYFQLAAILRAGLQGIRDDLPTPTATETDPETLSTKEREARDIRRLPRSLAEALDVLEADAVVRSWFPETLLDVYLRHKRTEVKMFMELSEAEQCARYTAAY